jgi:taurine dioxygenase
MTFTVNKVSDKGAAEIVGLDCSKPLDPAEMEDLKRAFLDNPVLCIRNQDLTATQQAMFSRQFGPLETQDRSKYCHPDDPDVLILSNDRNPDGSAVGIVDAGDFWHSDSSHMEEPCRMTILYAVKNPAKGGDTQYCNMYLVYEALPEDLKRRVEGRYAIHHISKTLNPRVTISEERVDAKDYYKEHEKKTAAVRQPMVRTHPETGRQALYISPRFTIGIDGMPDPEAQPLLDELFRFFVGNRRFEYRHKWRDRDLVMWDNRCLNHQAAGGYAFPDVRRMHRTTVRGDKPFYVPSAKAA